MKVQQTSFPQPPSELEIAPQIPRSTLGFTCSDSCFLWWCCRSIKQPGKNWQHEICRTQWFYYWMQVTVNLNREQHRSRVPQAQVKRGPLEVGSTILWRLRRWAPRSCGGWEFQVHWKVNSAQQQPVGHSVCSWVPTCPCASFCSSASLVCLLLFFYCSVLHPLLHLLASWDLELSKMSSRLRDDRTILKSPDHLCFWSSCSIWFVVSLLTFLCYLRLRSGVVLWFTWARGS